MRKYYKLALVVVTVVSLVCFVFYKTQYDRLYNVLQVLEFFGGDGVGVGVGVGRGSPDALSCSHAAWSPPSFRALGPDVQVYSAFCAGGDECDVVVVNALVRGDPAAAARCRLWLEGGRGGPVAAESVSLVDVPFSTLSARPPPPPASASSFHAAGIACRCQDGRGGGGGSSKTPYAVSLSIGEHEVNLRVENPFADAADQPLEEGGRGLLRRSSHGGGGGRLSDRPVGACVLPLPSESDATHPAAETVLLSSYFGAKHFMVYDGGGLPSGRLFRRVLGRAKVGADPRLDVRAAPWDLPAAAAVAEEEVEALVRADCFLRFTGHWDHAVLLRVGQVLVPGKGFPTVQAALESLTAADDDDGDDGRTEERDRLRVDVARFCPEFPASARAAKYSNTMVALEQTRRAAGRRRAPGQPEPAQSYAELHRLSPPASLRRSPLTPGQALPVARSVLEVRDYRPCGDDLEQEGDEEEEEDARLSGETAEAVLRTFGHLFPYKDV